MRGWRGGAELDCDGACWGVAYLYSLAARFLVRRGRLVDDADGDAVLDERECEGEACGARTDLRSSQSEEHKYECGMDARTIRTGLIGFSLMMVDRRVGGAHEGRSCWYLTT